MSQVIQTSFFDPLIEYITSVNENGVLKAVLPKNIIQDKESIILYFYEDFKFVPAKDPFMRLIEFTGMLRDHGLKDYLRGKLKEKTSGYFECETRLTDNPLIQEITIPKFWEK